MVVPTTKSLLSEGLVVASGTVRHPAIHPELALEAPGAWRNMPLTQPPTRHRPEGDERNEQRDA